MDHRHFDDLLRNAAYTASTRRTVALLLAGSALGGLTARLGLTGDAEAKAKHKKAKPKHERRPQAERNDQGRLQAEGKGKKKHHKKPKHATAEPSVRQRPAALPGWVVPVCWRMLPGLPALQRRLLPQRGCSAAPARGGARMGRASASSRGVPARARRSARTGRASASSSAARPSTCVPTGRASMPTRAARASGFAPMTPASPRTSAAPTAPGTRPRSAAPVWRRSARTGNLRAAPPPPRNAVPAKRRSAPTTGSAAPLPLRRAVPAKRRSATASRGRGSANST